MEGERKPIGATAPAGAVIVVGHELLWDGRLGDAIVRALGKWDERFSALARDVDRVGAHHRQLLSATWDVTRDADPSAVAEALETCRVQGRMSELANVAVPLLSRGAQVILNADTVPAPWGAWLGDLVHDPGLFVRANSVDDGSGELEFPFLHQCCACQTCTACPQAPVKEARRARQPVVYAGWSLVDRKAALLADVVIAAGPLAGWCEEAGVGFGHFDGFDCLLEASERARTGVNSRD